MAVFGAELFALVMVSFTAAGGLLLSLYLYLTDGPVLLVDSSLVFDKKDKDDERP